MAEVVPLPSLPLTEQEVFEACDALKADGETVSRRAVHKFLGRGSMTTVARLVSLWEDRQQAQVDAPDIELTAEERETITGFGRQMLRALTDRLRQEAAEKHAHLAERAEEQHRRYVAMAQDYEGLESDAKRGAEKLQSEIDHLTEELVQVQAANSTLTTAAEERERKLASERDRADREADRASRAEAIIDQEHRLRSEAQGKANQLEANLDELKKLHHDVTSAKDALSTENYKLNAEIALLDHRITSTEKEKTDLKAKLQQMHERVTILSAEKAALEAALKAAAQRGEEVSARLSIAESQNAEFVRILQQHAQSRND